MRLSMSGPTPAPPTSGTVTGIADHTREAQGVVDARLLDLVPSRSGKTHADWLKDRAGAFTARIKTAARDPSRGHADGTHDEHPKHSPS
jgi:transposase